MEKTTKKKCVRKPSVEGITLFLSDWKNPSSQQALMGLVYEELHRMAVRSSHREKPGRSLLPSDLLNEACIKLLKSKTVYENRRHFFGAAARAMRRILVERARRRDARKRGGDLCRVDFAEAERIGFDRPNDVLDFNTALARLANFRPSWSEVAELRVFGGWSTPEIATILGCGESTARRRWALARRWLASMLRAHR